MDAKQVELEEKMLLKFEQITNATASQFQQMDEKMESLRISFKKSLLDYHDFNKRKVDVLAAVTRYIYLCGSMVTIHYVVRNGLVYGISVKHNLCANHPSYITQCPNIDISIHSQCPDENVKVLNIDKIADAVMGEAALSYGYFNLLPRIWSGIITGFRQLSTEEYINNSLSSQELLYNGDQFPGMSGGAVLNGRGNFKLLFYFCLNSAYVLILYSNMLATRLPLVQVR